ncbi:hypothetical protein D9756_010079 [Leucocoprinus leucothites]|uniref:Nephrocystin 3-like N-terminal domain-containing protein n=1 Tax=Leucocoprinus leucothites TaxID=201217 RepID=A0A8H5FRW0_9AGAR|nr:hypothetical protein D9756_010079 [Leucoagaricus leucothites]
MEAQTLTTGFPYHSQDFDSISKPMDSIQPTETCTLIPELLRPQLSGKTQHLESSDLFGVAHFVPFQPVIFNKDLSLDAVDGYTRQELRCRVYDWFKPVRMKLLSWMYCPAGMGKSAIAQSLAEVLKPMNKPIVTSFFCSRSNADRDDPRRVFTSIAQIVSHSWWEEEGNEPSKWYIYATVLAYVVPRAVDGTSDSEVVHILSPSRLEERESGYLPANKGNPSLEPQNTSIHPKQTRRQSYQVPVNNCIAAEHNRRPRRELTTQHTANSNARNIKFTENTLSIETKKTSPDIRSRRCRPYTGTAWSSTTCGRKTVGIC